jgi:hypothetical protein
MAIDFPASPTLNDVFTVGNVTYVWDGTKWTASVTGGISLDKIEEGNTSAEVIDTGSDGRFVVTTEGTERLRVTNTGLVGIGTSTFSYLANKLVIDKGSTSNDGITIVSPNTSNGCIWFADGTTGSERYRGGIDYNHSTDNMQIYTGGLGHIVIDSAGNVGIGTTSPVVQLHIQGTTGASLRIQAGSTSAAQIDLIPGGTSNPWYIWADNTRNLVFQDFTAERMRIDSSGNVGIGTSTPGQKLDVNGEIVCSPNTAGKNTFQFTTQAADDASLIMRSNTTVKVNIQANGTSYFNGGNVGIGTTPDSPLHVVGAGGTGLRIGYTNNTNYFDANTQIFRSNNATTTYGQWDYSGRLLVGTSSGSGNNLLQVQGESGSSAGIGGIVLRRGLAPSLLVSGSIMGRIDFGPNDGGVGASIVGEGDAQQGTSDYPSRLVFFTTADGASSPTERMRIEQSGNIRFMNTGLVFPLTDNAVSLGLNGYRWTEVWAANGTIQTSDQRAKTDITSATLGSDFVKSLRPVSYRWVEGGKVDSGNRDEDGNYIYESVPGTRTHWGFIAQEVKQAVDATGVDFGGWLLTDKDDPDSQQALRYDQFIAPLTKALQEAIAKIETLEGMVAVNNITIDEQQHQLSTLAARLTALETP